MHFNQLKNELQNILSRKSRNSHDSRIQTIANHIGKSKRTSPIDKEKHKNKAEETSKLISFAFKYLGLAEKVIFTAKYAKNNAKCTK